MVNAQGGIYGRKLKLAEQLDDQLSQQPVRRTAAHQPGQRLRGAAGGRAALQRGRLAGEANIPTFGWTINDEWQGTAAEPKLNMFGESGSYLGITDASPVLPWLAQQTHRHKIGVLAYSVAQSAECATGVKNSFAKYGKDCRRPGRLRATSRSPSA